MMQDAVIVKSKMRTDGVGLSMAACCPRRPVTGEDVMTDEGRLPGQSASFSATPNGPRPRDHAETGMDLRERWHLPVVVASRSRCSHTASGA